MDGGSASEESLPSRFSREPSGWRSPPQRRGEVRLSHPTPRAILSSPDADPTARVAAIDWLGEHDPEAFTLDDLALLADPDLRVREAATVALRGAGDSAIVNAARRSARALVEGTTEERHAGLRAAGRLANPTLAPRLLPSLTHADPETRRLTLLALAAVPPGLLGPDFLVAPLELARQDVDAGVRAVAEVIIAKAEGAG